MTDDEQKILEDREAIKAERKLVARQSVTDLFDALSDSGQKRLGCLARKLISLAELDNSKACTVMLDAENQANRMLKRLTVPADMERVELVQSNGSTMEFTGALIRREEYKSKTDGFIIAAELWDTQAGAWIAVWEFDGGISAKQLEDGDTIGAMDFWKWGSVARNIARRLKWNLRADID